LRTAQEVPTRERASKRDRGKYTNVGGIVKKRGCHKFGEVRMRFRGRLKTGLQRLDSASAEKKSIDGNQGMLS